MATDANNDAVVDMSIEYDNVKFLHVEKNDDKVKFVVEFYDGGKTVPHYVNKIDWITILTAAAVGSSTLTIHGNEVHYTGYSSYGGKVVVEVKEFEQSKMRFVNVEISLPNH
ncbi:MAG TPA: hypothetical protein PLN36_01445 [Bacteroidales bacterium]|nr:hypothetical protein [Bacteroidales bacterium]